MKAATVDANGPLYLADFGGTGPPMVLVHGLGGSYVNWLMVAPLLAANYHVLAMDLPGYGRSPRAGRSGDLASNRKVLDDLIRSQAGGPVILVGNSMGGIISTLEAVEHPELIAGLVLVDSAFPVLRRHAIPSHIAGTFGLYSLPGIGDAVVRRYVASQGPESVTRGALAFTTAHPNAIPPTIVEAHIESFREQMTQPDSMASFMQGARSTVRHVMARKAGLGLLDRISCPVLVIHGSSDQLVNVDDARRIAKQHPTWAMQVLNDCGHMPQLEAPAQFVDAINRWALNAGLINPSGRPGLN